MNTHHVGGKAVPNMDLDHAYRHTLFFRKTDKNPAYAIVLDDIAKDKSIHNYCWQMLSWPDLEINLTDPNIVVISPKKADANETARMFVYIDSESPVTLKQEDYKVDPDDGRKPNVYPRLRAYSEAVNPYFAAVLIPTDCTVNAPNIKFNETADEKTILIEWPKRTDKIIWNKKDSKSRPQVLISDK